MSDCETTVDQLKDAVASFRDERDWRRYHNPKDLSAAIAIEAAELQELFLWTEADACIDHLRRNSELRGRFADELADIMIFCLSLANITELDLSEAIRHKLTKNRDKYPAHIVRGKAGLGSLDSGA